MVPIPSVKFAGICLSAMAVAFYIEFICNWQLWPQLATIIGRYI